MDQLAEYDLDRIHCLLAASQRLDAERRLEYIVDTMSAVGGLFDSKGSALKDRLDELSKTAGIEDGK